MLTKDEIQVLIVMRLMAACDSCNKYHINRCEGQIEALVSVLTGKRFHSDGECRDILDAAEIPWKPLEGDEGWDVAPEWLIERGCVVNGNNISHPKLSDW